MRNSFNKVLVWKCPESRQFRVSWTKCRTQTAATVQHAKILWTSCESVRHWHRHRRASPHRCEHSKWRGSSWYSIFNEIWFCLVFFCFFLLRGRRNLTKRHSTAADDYRYTARMLTWQSLRLFSFGMPWESQVSSKILRWVVSCPVTKQVHLLLWWWWWRLLFLLWLYFWWKMITEWLLNTEHRPWFSSVSIGNFIQNGKGKKVLINGSQSIWFSKKRIINFSFDNIFLAPKSSRLGLGLNSSKNFFF